MTTRRHPVHSVVLPDPLAEQAQRSQRNAIRDLQQGPLARARIIKDVELEDATDTVIQHGFGRRAVVLCSPPRRPTGAGAPSGARIEEVRATKYDAKRVVVLQANGWSGTITVDVVLL